MNLHIKIKKAFSALAFIVAGACSAAAQNTDGYWNLIPTFTGEYSQLQDTPERVYLRTQGNLYSIDNTTGEMYEYTSQNKLSDSYISGIYYNPDGKYLVVAYSNGNMDALYDSGKVVNLPDIVDADLLYNRSINDISFAQGLMIVSTNFGIVVYDADTLRVKESGIYDKNITSATAIPGYLLLVDDTYLKFSPLDARHSSLSSFQTLHQSWGHNYRPLGDRLFYTCSRTESGANVTYANAITISDIENKKYQSQIRIADYIQGTPVYAADGTLQVASSTGLQVFSEKGADSDTNITLPASLKNHIAAGWKPAQSLWVATEDGVGNYKITDATATVLREPVAPNANCVSEVAFISFSKDGSRVYFCNNEVTQGLRDCFNSYQPDGWGNAWFKQQACVLENGKFKNITGYISENNGIPAPKNIVPHPTDPDVYFQGSSYALYVVRGNKVVKTFDYRNMPQADIFGYTMALWVEFDDEGNLWVGGKRWEDFSRSKSTYVMLPAAKALDTSDDYASITINDWKTSAIKSANQRDVYTARTTGAHPYVFLTTGNWFSKEAPLNVMDTKGTPSNLDDDVAVYYSDFYDQDGRKIEINIPSFVLADKKNHVWVGTDKGLFVIRDLDQLFPQRSSVNVVRPKVPRNDGTNFADILLESESITWMAVDHSNRKWIGTKASGVYLVNEDGSEILANFNTSNSPLPTNSINVVECSPLDNTVYIGTNYGLITYSSNSSPASEDLSEVYAYPNPVRPDYNGWVTVTGLMDGTLVKIADASGNIVFQGTSEGGMVAWDACNSDGSRVKTGVYFVFASAADGSEAAVAKILVLN
ncbi:MAG: hypothetical protein K2M79_00105 [Muribaculaceae bacterium]|nr:hypothetical protein [Muribaculaceae bacterium]